MRCKFVFGVFMALLWASSAGAQAVKEPAALMPAKTLSYAEVRQAGKLAKEIAGLFQGSVLGNVPDSLQELRGKYEKQLSRPALEATGVLGLMLAPEIVAELGRMQGAAIGFTGISPEHEPEFLAVVLPGQSNAPAFFMRMLQTMAPTRKIESVDGVVLYRMVFKEAKKTSTAIASDKFDKTPPPPPPPPVEPQLKETGPVFAMMPGAVFIGSQNNVKDAILRIKGKLNAPSLAQDATFQEARMQMENKPGLFTYINPGLLMPMLEKEGGMTRDGQEIFAALHQMINFKAIRAVAHGFSMDQGKLTVRKVALLDPKEKSLLLDLVPTKPVNTELLHFAPRDTIFAVALDNSDGAERWQKFLALADLFPAGRAKVKSKFGEKPLPQELPPPPKFSAGIQQMEQGLGIQIGKDIVGQIASAAFVVGDPLKATMKIREETGPNSHSMQVTTEVPVLFLLHANDEKAAENLVKLVPTIFGGGKAASESTQSIEGREIHSLKMGKHEALHYGRQGATVVLGPFAAPVARALISGAKRQGLLSNPQAAAHLKDMKDRQAVAFVKPAHLIAGLGLAFMSHSSHNMGKTTSGTTDNKNGKEPEAKKPEIKETTRSLADDPIMKEWSKVLGSEDFLVLGMRHTSDKIQVDGQVTGLHKLIPQLIDFQMEQMYRSSTQAWQSGTAKPGRTETKKLEK